MGRKIMLQGLTLVISCILYTSGYPGGTKKGSFKEQTNNPQNEVINDALYDYPSYGDYGNTYDYDTSYDYDSTDYTGLGHGVDPITTEEEKGHHLGTGVEPISSDYDVATDTFQSSEEDEHDGYDWSNFWNIVTTKIDDVTNSTKKGFSSFVDQAGDFVDTVDDAFDNFTEDVSKKAKKAGAVITDIAIEAKHGINNAWEGTKQQIPEIWEKFKKVLATSGQQVEKGAVYIKEKCVKLLDQARGMHILQRLEQKLEEGDEHVAEFFTCVGKKLSEWSAKHTRNSNEVDDGLIGPAFQYDDVHNQHFDDPGYPNLLQDKEVHTALEKLVEQGIVDHQDVEALYQTTASQGVHNINLLDSWEESPHNLKTTSQIVQG